MNTTIDFDAIRLIDKKQLKQLIPYSLSYIAKLEKAGKFPQRIKLGPSRVAWRFREVVEWVDTCAHARFA